ncbi:MAG: hypothetical protein JWM88_2500 [Verrucomicrobia bacterium]|nr:hypothetical protein [Verrucomicrobiota bacterium]
MKSGTIKTAARAGHPPAESGSTATAPSLAALERDNARLRGDLRTIGRRLVHDLRNPLNCISTANEALRDPSAAPDSIAERLAQSVSGSVGEAMTLVERLSVVLIATANPKAAEKVEMTEIVADTLRRLDEPIMKAGATVLQPPEWPSLRGVPAWLNIIWDHLVLNALQHGGPAPRLELGWTLIDGEHRCWLRDSGPGVPEQKRARLFFPLEQLHELSAPRGYGLPIIQRLVQLQGGRCGYQPGTAPGAGFFFTLPAA